MTVLSVDSEMVAIFSATSTGFTRACGTRMGMTTSTFGSSTNNCMALSYSCGSAPPNISTGLATCALGFSTSRRACMVSGCKSAIVKPLFARLSDNKAAGPPEFVRMATFFPLGNGCNAKACDTSNKSLTA